MNGRHSTCVVLGWTRKFPRKKKTKQKTKTKQSKKPLKAISRQHTLYFIGSWIAITTNGRHLTCVDLGWVAKTVKNLVRLACKFDFDHSEHSSSQVNASAIKAWPNGVTSYDSVWSGLQIVLWLSKMAVNRID